MSFFEQSPRRAVSAPAGADPERGPYGHRIKRVPTNHVDSCCVAEEHDLDHEYDENHDEADGERTRVGSSDDAHPEMVANKERDRLAEVEADLSPEARTWKDNIVTYAYPAYVTFQSLLICSADGIPKTIQTIHKTGHTDTRLWSPCSLE